jgi:protein-S-isoprenylcysteine O-methyltransferase
MQSNFVFISSDARVLFFILIGIFGISELVGLSRKRAGALDQAEDRGSLRLLIAVIPSAALTGGAAAWFSMNAFPQGVFGSAAIFSTGIGVMIVGQLLRSWAILTLGRLFTFNVAIRTDHRVIDSGPYRYIRHPAYAAVLLVHLGISLCWGNVLSVVVIMVPVTLALMYRIQVEEAVLALGLGDEYLRYMGRTKRLIPGVY